MGEPQPGSDGPGIARGPAMTVSPCAPGEGSWQGLSGPTFWMTELRP